jgi:hypothetical protein
MEIRIILGSFKGTTLTKSPSPRRRWLRPLLTFSAVLVITITVAVIGLMMLVNELEASTSNGETMSAEDKARNDESLRDEPTLEATATELKAVLVNASDALSAAFPYLQFEWKREATSIQCAGHAEAYSWKSAGRIAEIPILEADWNRALEIVVDLAAALGPVRTGAYHDKPGMRDILISAGDFTINFASIKATVLFGDAPCRLPQSALDETP